MRISERATARIGDMPEREEPLSEQFRITAKAWVDLDGAARMLESCKDAVLFQLIKKQGDIPVAKAERDVKSSQEWFDYVRKTVDARTAANLKKMQLDYIRIKCSEWTSAEANARHEAKL